MVTFASTSSDIRATCHRDGSLYSLDDDHSICSQDLHVPNWFRDSDWNLTMKYGFNQGIPIFPRIRAYLSDRLRLMGRVRKPDAVIIGTQKGGTVSASINLSRHPRVFFPAFEGPCFTSDRVALNEWARWVAKYG